MIATYETVAVAFALLLGACVGSFLNVVIARVPAGLSIVRPRSRCPRCLAPIAATDNVPVLSWLVLRGRCRACAAPISIRYPLVELAGAGAAWLALSRNGWSPAALAELGLVALLLALALVDLDTWLLPHALTWPLLLGGLALSAAELTPAGDWRQAFWGAGAGFAAFAAVAVLGEKVFGREALGGGDVWLLAGLGAWLGVKALLPVVLLASLQGTIVGLVLAAMGRLPKGEQEAGSEPGSPSPSPSPPAGEREKMGAAPTRVPTADDPLPLPRSGGGEGQGEGAEPASVNDWTPPRNAVPFGPFLVAGALEWLYLGGRIARWVPTLEVFR